MTGTENKVLKSGIWYIISNIMIRAVGILTSPIYTRMLSPAEKGIADSCNMWLGILNTITCLCLIYSVGRAKLDFKDTFHEYMSSIQTLSSGFALIILGIAMLQLKTLSLSMDFQKVVIILMFIYLVLYPSVDYMQYKYRFEYKYKENILIAVIICVTQVAMSIGLMYYMPSDRAFAKILGTILPVLCVAVWCYVKLLKSGKVLYNKKYWQYAIKIGAPMIPHGLALVLLARMDVIMIKAYCNDSVTGIYTTGYATATLLAIITNAIGQAWIPWFNERLYEDDIEAIKKKNLLMMELGCFLTLGLIVVAPEITKILTGKNFWESMWLIPPVAIGTLCQYFYTNYVNVELFHKKTFIIAMNSILAALLNYGLNLVFIPRYGYLAAGYTTMVSYFALNIFHYIACRWILRQKIYRDGTYFLLMFVTGAVGLSFLMIYNTIWLRYGIGIVIFAVVMIIKRKDVIIALDFLKKKYGRISES